MAALLRDRRGSFSHMSCQSLHGLGLWLLRLFLRSQWPSVEFRASTFPAHGLHAKEPSAMLLAHFSPFKALLVPPDEQ